MLRKGDEPIPGYRLAHFLGRGAFGEVWRASAPGGTSAALKFIDLNGKQGLKEYRAVQRVKEVRHAHLLPIYAFWMLDQYGDVLTDTELEAWDLSGSVMPTQIKPELLHVEARPPATLVVAMLLGDKSLSDRLDECRGPKDEPRGIPIDELLDYMEDAAKGVDFLNSPRHDLGDGPVALQHCDIKPQNLLLVGNSVLVCDFGLARVLGDDQRTKTALAGSPAYMAPEVIRNRKPSSATDQYALAITYFELRTGRLPFDHESYAAVLDAHLRGKLDWSLLGEPEQAIIRKATALEPKDRFATSLEMIRALRRAVGHDSAIVHSGVGTSSFIPPGVGSSVVQPSGPPRPQDTAVSSSATAQTVISKTPTGGDSHGDSGAAALGGAGSPADLASSRETALVTQSTVDSTSAEEPDEHAERAKPSPAKPGDEAIDTAAMAKSAHVEPAKRKPAERPVRESKSSASGSRTALSLVLWLAVAGGLAFAAWKYWPRDTSVTKPTVPKKNQVSPVEPPPVKPVETPNKTSDTKPPVKNGTPPVVPQLATARLRFDPPDSRVTIDGQLASLSPTGETQLEAPADKQIAVAATREGYRDYAATRSLAEWQSAGSSIRLEPLPPDYVAEAREMLAQGRVPQAIAFLERAIAVGNATRALYATLGEARQQLGDHPSAVDAFTKAIAADAKAAGAYRSRAASYVQMKKWTEAIADLEHFTELAPQSAAEVVADRVAALAGRVYEALAADRTDDALRDAAQALDLAGEHPSAKATARVARGAVRRKRDQLDDAIDDFRAAAKLDADIAGRLKPALAEALLVRGRASNEKALQSGAAKLFDAAIEDLTESITLAPNDESYAARGFAYNARREYDKAIQDFTRALAINSRNVLAYHNRGFSYNAKQEYNKAVEDFSAAIRLKPNDHPSAYNNRGLAYLQLGEFDKAIDDYTEAIRQSRVEPEQSKVGLAFAFRGRGERFEKQGDFDKAEADYTKALEHAAKAPQLAAELRDRISGIASNRATALALKGNLGEALAVAEEYVARHPKEPEAYATRAYVYFKRRQYRESLADYTRAIEFDPKNPKHYMRRGMVHTVDRNTNAAIKDLSTAIDLDKTLVEAYQLRAKAYEQRGLQADAAAAAADQKKAAELSKKTPDASGASPPVPNAPLK